MVNYQDHFELAAKHDVSFQVKFPSDPGADLRLPASGGITVARDQVAVFPFHQDLDGLELVSATAQPICRIEAAGEPWWFFFTPEGVEAVFAVEGAQGREELRSSGRTEEHWAVERKGGGVVHLVLVPQAQARRLYRVELAGRTHLVLSDALVRSAVGPGGLAGLALEHGALGTPSLAAFPALPEGCVLGGSPLAPLAANASTLFTGYKTSGTPPEEASPPEVAYTLANPRKARVRLPEAPLADVDDLILVVEYEGDVGTASVDGTLVHDHFANGDPWEISLTSVHNDVAGGVWGKELVVSIVPRKAGAFVVSNTTMAGRKEENLGESGRIVNISLRAVKTSWVYSRG